MRIKLKKPKVGEYRFVRKFLFLPVKIQEEIRWLEFARIEQRYIEKCIYDNWAHKTFYKKMWENIRFVDYEPKYNEHKVGCSYRDWETDRKSVV